MTPEPAGGTGGSSAWLRGGRRWICVCTALGLIVAPAAAHILVTFDSVHFHPGAPDFGTAPHRVVLRWRGEWDDRPIRKDEDENRRHNAPDIDPDRDEARLEARLNKRSIYVARASAAEMRCDWAGAAHWYRSTARLVGWSGGLRDRDQVVSRLAGRRQRLAPAISIAARAYLTAVEGMADRRFAATAATLRRLEADPSAGFLRDEAAYQIASIAYATDDFKGAVLQYRGLLDAYPHGIKREEALIMLARCAILPATGLGRSLPDGAWALNRLAMEFPRSRFRRDSIGLQARLDFLSGNWRPALEAYFRVGDLDSVDLVIRAMPESERSAPRVRLLGALFRSLARAATFGDYQGDVARIESIAAWLTPANAAAFRALALADPTVAAPYLEYRVEHGPDTPAAVGRIADFALAFAGRWGARRLPHAACARVAETFYADGNYRDALRWARRVADTSDLALYVAAASLQKLHRDLGAAAAFRRLAARSHAGDLQRGAHEELAILYEAGGDLSGALEQYLTLGYRLDVAYLLDVRMTIPQIEAFLQTRDGRSARLDRDTVGLEEQDAARYRTCDLIRYSLGIRCLRANRWDAAIAAFEAISRSERARLNAPRVHFELSGHAPDALTAAYRMRELDRAVQTARTPAARAAALYDLGLYYSTHGTLLLYNGALWQGMREEAFDFSWNRSMGSEHTAALRAYMYEHEAYARSRAIYLQLASEYPRSAQAPAALYRAACDCRRLAVFSRWWNAEGERHSSWDASVSLMNEVALRYPHSPLAPHARKYARVFANEAHPYTPE